MKGTHEYDGADRNQDILIDINGELLPREKAVVSVFDSGFVLGDGVWEGLRVESGTILFLEQHLDRLYEGMHTLDFEISVSKEALTQRLYAALQANDMHDGVHIRLMVSRGVKSTPYQDPRMTVTPPTIVIIPEYKTALPETVEKGVTLFTVHVRRGYSDVQDPTLNTHSKLNCVTACIQAAKAGCDEALMLDPHGFVATCNSTHFFIVRRGELWTSTGDYCLDGITRRKVLNIAAAEGMTVRERNFTLTDVYNAEESFVTGTFAGLVPVREVDGRTIGTGERGPVVSRLQSAYRRYVADYIEGPGRLHRRSEDGAGTES
ncbi:aminotransferase class IV [Congregibacter litoralis]|uniref:Aminodeoxychorismate lyase n=1 Tax=Congregibacter litoralis KT71 TaxID=314285 RepID=A4AD02_9GAMM|nr:aminotransferase class IV [Congregibacter litoralis]EAQ96055.1 Branched-chain amino acid aminotransferase/4-amino-4-deoxychorismate lyase [Congregibacter litoralis KT71]